MKNQILTLLFLFTLIFCTAQNRPLTWSAQIGQGINFTKLDLNNIYFDVHKDGIKNHISYSNHFGANLSIPFHESYGLRVGLHYSRFNTRITGVETIGPFGTSDPLTLENEVIQSIRAISIPFVYESKIKNGFLRLGFQYALLFQRQSTIDTETFVLSTGELQEYKFETSEASFNQSELGFNFSYSYMLRPYLSIDVQSFIGFLRLAHIGGALYSGNGMNRQFTLGLSYYLREKP